MGIHRMECKVLKSIFERFATREYFQFRCRLGDHPIMNSEIQNTRLGAYANVRSDGRGIYDCRIPQIQIGELLQSNGSARVSIIGDLCIVASTKLELCSFEQTPSNDELVSLNIYRTSFTDTMGANEDIVLGMTLKRLMFKHSSDMYESLCIAFGKCYWKIYIDVKVLECNGSLPYYVSMAILAAVKNTSIPCTASRQENDLVHYSVEEDIELSKKLKAQRLSLCTTAATLGSCFVLDPTTAELNASPSQFCIAINEERLITGIQQYGPGCVSFTESQERIAALVKYSIDAFNRLQEI